MPDLEHPANPSTTPSTSSSAQKRTQTRDNQRRARARRAEYLRDLEAKHAVCVRDGARASEMLQRIARRVCVENARLRRENARLKEELSGKGMGRVGGEERGEKDESGEVEDKLDMADLTQLLDVRIPCCGTGHGEQEQRLPLAPTIASSCGSSAPTPAHPVLAINGAESDPPEMRRSGISCRDAADIVRGVTGNEAEIERSFGCAPGAECRLEYGSVFEVMNRFV